MQSCGIKPRYFRLSRFSTTSTAHHLYDVGDDDNDDDSDDDDIDHNGDGDDGDDDDDDYNWPSKRKLGIKKNCVRGRFFSTQSVKSRRRKLRLR